MQKRCQKLWTTFVSSPINMIEKGWLKININGRPLIYTSTCLLLCPEHPDQNGPCPREPHLESLLHLLTPFCLLVCSKTLSEWRSSSGSIWPHICLCICLCLCLFICVWYLLDLIGVSQLPRESQQARYGLVGQPNHLSLHHRGHWTSCGQSTERSP